MEKHSEGESSHGEQDRRLLFWGHASQTTRWFAFYSFISWRNLFQIVRFRCSAETTLAHIQGVYLLVASSLSQARSLGGTLI